VTYIRFDFESRSMAPIRWGVDNYFLPAQPLILTWAVDEAQVQLHDYVFEGPTAPVDRSHDGGATWVAHNCQFDRRVRERLLGVHIPIERYRCTQAQAYAHGLPGSLETLGEVLGIKQRKLTGEDGHKLMLFFCTPRSITKSGHPIWNEPKDHPEKWEAFKRYAIRDTEALREIHKKLPTWNYQPVRGLDEWFLDQRINERGFGFDSTLATAASKVLDAAKVQQKKYASFVTGGSVTSVTQREKLLAWFNASGLEIANLKASEIRDALDSDELPPHHRFLLELRLEGSKSSGAKYRRGLECVGPDGRLRDTAMFSGANRTGRWAHRGFQPGNQPRPRALWEELDKENPWKPIEDIAVPAILSNNEAVIEQYGGGAAVCNDAIRSCIVAQPGNELISADWSNIESRFLAWCTDNHWKLDYFRMVDRGEAPDSYKMLWAKFFNMRIEDVTKSMRQAAKVTDLALGFLGGTGALVSMAVSNGVDMSEWPELILPRATDAQRKKAAAAWRRAFLEGEDFGVSGPVYQAADILKQLYRTANSAVVDTGYDIGSVVLNAMRNINSLHRVAKCNLWYNGHALIIELPCGRRLFYWSPQLRQESEVDAETGKLTTREVFWYKASRGKQWRWLKGWPGLWIENIVQGGANSILRAGMLNVQRFCEQDFKISTYLSTLPENRRTGLVLTVHDEAVLELPVDMLPYGKLEWLLTEDLKTKHAWLRDIPLAASGWQGPRYRK
jgi:DNA polymerase